MKIIQMKYILLFVLFCCSMLGRYIQASVYMDQVRVACDTKMPKNDAVKRLLKLYKIPFMWRVEFFGSIFFGCLVSGVIHFLYGEPVMEFALYWFAIAGLMCCTYLYNRWNAKRFLRKAAHHKTKKELYKFM